MTVGDDARPDLKIIHTERGPVSSPILLAADPAGAGTGLILFPRADSLPAAWIGPLLAATGPAGTGPAGTGPAGLDPADAAALLAATRPCP